MASSKISQPLHGNISTDDLRFLLGYVDKFNKEIDDFSGWLNEVDQKPSMENLPTFGWAHLYERSYQESVNHFFSEAQLTDELGKISASENKIRAIHDFQLDLTRFDRHIIMSKLERRKLNEGYQIYG